MKSNILLILLLCVSMVTLACVAAPAAIPTPTSSNVPRPTEQPTPERMTVIAETLHIRNAPSGVALKDYLKSGDVVTIYERDGNWCRIGVRKWVACWWLK